MNQSNDNDQEQVYQELRRRAVAQFGEARAAELESYLRTAAEQVAAVNSADVDPDLEPLFQE